MPDYQSSRLKTPYPLQYQRPAESTWSNDRDVRVTCIYCRVLGLVWAIPLAIATTALCLRDAPRGGLDLWFFVLLYIVGPLQFLAAYWISAGLIRRGRRGAILVALIYNYAAMAYAGACMGLSSLGLAVGGVEGNMGGLVLALTLLLAWFGTMARAAAGLHGARNLARMYG